MVFNKDNQRGASAVEFALVMPFLLLVLFGVIEFSWVFAQNLDVRHGAREAGRLAAVNYPDFALASPGSRTAANRDALVAEICDRMDVASDAEVGITSDGAVNDEVSVTVSAGAQTLTGFLDWALPPTLILTSEIESRIEQQATWADTSGAQSC